MKSIRRRLLQSLLLGTVLIASITGALLYRHMRSELDELYNGHLHQVARFMASEWERKAPSLQHSTPVKPPTKLLWAEEDYLVQLWRRDGLLLAQQIPAVMDVNIPLYPREGLFRQQLNKEIWRIYRADSAGVIVQIAQPEFARTNTIRETSLQLLLPLVLQVPLLMIMVWFSVRQGLNPLRSLTRAIDQRRPDALTPVELADLPLELQPLVSTLNALLSRLGAALEQQRHFVADAAHELRTPIAALQLQLDILQRAVNTNERDQAVSQLRVGLQRATHLAQQLLSIARAEIEFPQLVRGNIDLESLIKGQMEKYLPLARTLDLDLGVTRLEQLDILCVRSDIESVLDNLINNAIRYTPRGGRIDVAGYRDGNHAVMEVADSGPGIPQHEQARIFDRFYRVPHSGTDFIEGSGLGLAIVKTICDRHGADIQISAGDNGVGARFAVYWPLENALVT